jgi:hypothetical protein
MSAAAFGPQSYIARASCLFDDIKSKRVENDFADLFQIGVATRPEADADSKSDIQEKHCSQLFQTAHHVD